jgi:L-arabinonolactonase
MTAASAGLVHDLGHQLGEGVTWCHRSQAFYWTDIEGSALYRDSLDGRAPHCWPLPERLSSFALCEDNRYLLLGLASQLAFFEIATGVLTPLVKIETDLPTRLNDGRCDREGRFVFGTMDETPQHPKIGGFYRLNRDLSLERLPLPPVQIPNSIGFAPEGGLMYYCDTLSRTVRCCDYNRAGEISNDRQFVALTDADGFPDGSTVDAQGGLWNAQWGGRRIVRYGPDGRETHRIEVPTAQPSCVAFGGPLLDTLYITTARVELEAEALLTDPHAGGIFSVKVAARGLAESRFGGVPPGVPAQHSQSRSMTPSS